MGCDFTFEVTFVPAKKNYRLIMDLIMDRVLYQNHLQIIYLPMESDTSLVLVVRVNDTRGIIKFSSDVL